MLAKHACWQAQFASKLLRGPWQLGLLLNRKLGDGAGSYKCFQ